MFEHVCRRITDNMIVGHFSNVLVFQCCNNFSNRLLYAAEMSCTEVITDSAKYVCIFEVF